MRKVIDMHGFKSGRLTVVGPANRKDNNGSVMWLCRCECGRHKDIGGPSLRSGHSKSCGHCHQRQRGARPSELTARPRGGR